MKVTELIWVNTFTGMSSAAHNRAWQYPVGGDFINVPADDPRAVAEAAVGFVDYDVDEAYSTRRDDGRETIQAWFCPRDGHDLLLIDKHHHWIYVDYVGEGEDSAVREYWGVKESYRCPNCGNRYSQELLGDIRSKQRVREHDRTKITHQIFEEQREDGTTERIYKVEAHDGHFSIYRSVFNDPPYWVVFFESSRGQYPRRDSTAHESLKAAYKAGFGLLRAAQFYIDLEFTGRSGYRAKLKKGKKK